MTKAQLFMLLLNVAAKGSRRNPPDRRSGLLSAVWRAGVWLVWMWLAGLGFLAGRMSLAEGPTLIFGLMPHIMLFDFAMRFALQQSPMRLRPFLLLPVRRRTAAACCLLAAMRDKYNLAWVWLFVPYAIAGPAASGHGFLFSAAIVLTCLLLMAAANLLYILVSSLASLSSAWWWLPAAVCSAVFAVSLTQGSSTSAGILIGLCSRYGFTPAAVTAYAVAAAGLWRLDTGLLLRLSLRDDSSAMKQPRRRTAALSFARHSLTAEYLRMEILSTMRNRTPKRNLCHGLLLTVVFCAVTLLSPNPAEPDLASASWCVYCFLLLPTASLTRIMETEGNSFSLLMTHKDSLWQLLKAKYAFSCLTLLLPLAVLAPAAATGRLPWALIAAGLLTASGTAHFILFQLAASNRQAVPADTTATPKDRHEAGRQLAACMAVLATPALLLLIADATAGSDAALPALTATGALLTATNRLWLRAIHRRMVRRKYYLAEGFSQTRQT